MTEATPVANFEGMSGFRTVVYDAANVEEDVWREVQELHRDSLLARLPEGERYRADVLTSWDDPRSYQASRANPNVLVGIEFNDDQIYRRPKLATVLDLSGQMVAAALTADNSSADRLPKRLRPYEARVKMHVRPSMNIPIIGGKRYDHLRDAFSRADAQTGQENELGQRIVNGVVLAAIYHSLAEVYPEQDLADYVAIEDPADAEMTDITAILKMKYTGTLRPDQLPGYRGKKVRFQKQVGEAMKNIIELPGAKQAIERRLDGEMYVSRLTVKSSKKAEREERYRHRRDSYREMAARERIGLKPSS